MHAHSFGNCCSCLTQSEEVSHPSVMHASSFVRHCCCCLRHPEHPTRTQARCARPCSMWAMWSRPRPWPPPPLPSHLHHPPQQLQQLLLRHLRIRLRGQGLVGALVTKLGQGVVGVWLAAGRRTSRAESAGLAHVSAVRNGLRRAPVSMPCQHVAMPKGQE